jgi:hypothetical protein
LVCTSSLVWVLSCDSIMFAPGGWRDLLYNIFGRRHDVPRVSSFPRLLSDQLLRTVKESLSYSRTKNTASKCGETAGPLEIAACMHHVGQIRCSQRFWLKQQDSVSDTVISCMKCGRSINRGKTSEVITESERQSQP